MNDMTALQWSDVKEIINTIGVLMAIIISIVGLVKSSKQKQSDQLDSIQKALTQHILDDERSITKLETNVENLTNNVSSKLDTIIRELDK
jgi:uncharacterized membrane protein